MARRGNGENGVAWRLAHRKAAYGIMAKENIIKVSESENSENQRNRQRHEMKIACNNEINAAKINGKISAS
jgi:hypothetical protein